MSDTGYLGQTPGGPPAYGTFHLGEWVIDVTGAVWICIASGSPGTWAAAQIAGANTWTGANTFASTARFNNGLTIPEGSNAYMGTVAVNGTAPVTVATTAVSANSRIFLTTQVPGGTVASPYVSATSAATSFQVASSGTADTSTVAWLIINHT